MPKLSLRVAMLGRSALTGSICSILLATQAVAQSATYRFDIRSEPLAAALHDLSRISGKPIIFTSAQVAGKTVTGLHGKFTVDQALARLFVGTNLVVDHSSAAGLMVQSTPPAETSVRVPDREQAAVEETGTDIVVMAQKKAERLQDVPVSVTQIQAKTLSDQGLFSLRDFASRVPGITYTTNNQQTLALQGITTGSGTAATVAITIDDVPFGSSTAYGQGLLPDIDPAVLENVEVLRGPQGTLYGASSLGGLIKYVTVKPDTNHFSGRIEAGASVVDGGGRGYSTRGSVNIPILADKLALSVSGFYREDPSFTNRRDPISAAVDSSLTPVGPTNSGYHSNSNRTKIYGGRAALLFRPIEPLTITLAANIQRQSSVDANLVYYTRSGQLLFGDLTYSNAASSGKGQADLYEAKIVYNTNLFDIASVTGYSRARKINNSDATTSFSILSPALGLPNDTRYGFADNSATNKWSEELRLSSKPGRIEWLAGLFWTHENSALDQILTAASPSGSSYGVQINDLVPSSYTEIAAFGDVTYHFTPKFDIQVGGRYFHNSQKYSEITTGNPVVIGAPSPFIYPSSSSHESKGTWLVTSRYRINPSLMTYLRISTGYRPGGPNTSLPSIPNRTYRSDTVTDYEVGMKGDFFNRRLNFDLSLFWIDWNNIQLIEIDPVSQFGYFTNGKSARSRGFEATVGYLPWRGMNIGANFTYDDAVLTNSLPTTAQGGNSSGQDGTRLPYVARYSGNFSAEQSFPISPAVNGFVGGTLSYVGNRQAAFANLPTAASGPIPRVTLPDYTNIDMRIGLRFTTLSVTFYLRNVTDKRGFLSGGLRTASRPNNGMMFSVIQPRTFGFNVAKTF